MEQAKPPIGDRRRRIVGAIGAIGAFGALAAVRGVGAQSAGGAGDFPNRSIRLVLPYTTGGSADALARAIAEQMRARLGQPVVVDSRPGANSMLGAELVAKAPADGYTLLYLGWPTISTNLVTYPDARYRLEDFQPITPFFRSPIGLTVHKDSPIRDFAGLLEFGRRNGSLSFGTSGAGSSPHLLLEKLKTVTGVNFVHVPYKGEGPAVLDVLGGHLPVFGGSIATPLQHVRSGALRIVVTSSAERLPAFPDVPTFKEVGFGEHVFTYWHGLAAPAGTPRPVIERIHGAVVAAIGSPEVQRVLSPDQVATTLSPDAFMALIRDDIATWGPVIRAMNPSR